MAAVREPQTLSDAFDYLKGAVGTPRGKELAEGIIRTLKQRRYKDTFIVECFKARGFDLESLLND